MGELKARLAVLTTTEMAVIVSPGANEIEQMKKLGLDIESHRRRMNESQPALDERFKGHRGSAAPGLRVRMWLNRL